MCTEVKQIEVKSDSGSPQAAAEGNMHVVDQGVRNPEEGGPLSLNTSEVSFRPHPDEVTLGNVHHLTIESVQVDSEMDAIADTEVCRSARPGDILFSVPAQPTQEVPVDVTKNRSVPDTEEESQLILQFATDGHTEMTVMSSVGQINTRDKLEAGPVISEAHPENAMQEGDNIYHIWLTQHKIYRFNPPLPKKQRKVL